MWKGRLRSIKAWQEKGELSMREYSWKGTGYSADAQLVGEELEKLEFAGEVTPDEVLKFAKNNIDSELYKCFEWDDKICGEKYRKL